MQYINKHNTEPVDWNHWFTVPPARRTFDYGADYSALTNLNLAKLFLIEEQFGLCAYCQQKITLQDASIEHITPKEHNKELSTNYYNLVAVCKKQQVKDSITRTLHCDSTRGSELIPPLVFYSNSQSTLHRTNKYFEARSNGEIVPKKNLDLNTYHQVESFINTLNLNHTNLVYKRAKDTLRGIIDAYICIPNGSHQKAIFWRMKYQNVLNNPNQEFREFLLIFLGKKIGLN